VVGGVARRPNAVESRELEESREGKKGSGRD